jgi:hypothetical protein
VSPKPPCRALPAAWQDRRPDGGPSQGRWVNPPPDRAPGIRLAGVGVTSTPYGGIVAQGDGPPVDDEARARHQEDQAPVCWVPVVPVPSSGDRWLSRRQYVARGPPSSTANRASGGRGRCSRWGRSSCPSPAAGRRALGADTSLLPVLLLDLDGRAALLDPAVVAKGLDAPVDLRAWHAAGDAERAGRRGVTRFGDGSGAQGVLIFSATCSMGMGAPTAVSW